ncbi:MULTISPECIES: autotransporter domain-containing protein [unclassified Beijerinckia]|uniref:autotransporter outer membrane beta-barrel domain-containing protein n=1 Tax=unclassified Beijerinckia TaxID=2638183 RepID=UPI000897CE13|nr:MULTISPECIES: autotransporter domain-containing protein [unclassified Beijerinckia]MDH7795537.1 subtilase-type serine protease [Beijerinckia sp. GAS462]SEC05653.1 outer membrane autotransporter barrel domain-containing protein [Beijerinckia sp. 28-YEA-48]
MPSLYSRVSPLSLIILSCSFGITSAIAADITIPAGTTSTGARNFGGTDQITIGAGATLTSAANPTLNQNSAATGVVIDNAGTIESTGTGTRAIRFNNGTAMTFTLTNRAGATIQSQNDAVQVGQNVSSGTIIVNNYGTIQATGVNGNNGQSIDFGNITAGTASITINNYAGGLLQTADADGIRPGNNATVNNAGSIIAHDYLNNTGADGVDFQNSTGGTVVNSGLISGGRHGINHGYDAASNSPSSYITVINEAGGEIIGRNGSGFGSDVGGKVINYGLISGRIDDRAGVPNGDGDGVDIDYIGDITNYGIIEGIGAKGVGSDGLTNTAQGIAIGGGVIRNMAGGIIRSTGDGILVDNSSQGPAFGAIEITNAGTITGDRYGIYINSTLDNVITNSGTITGGNGQAIVFGSGNDTLNIRTGSVINGAVDGGGGYNRISLDGTGTFAGAINFQTMSVDSGSWTLTGTQSYADGISIAGGAALNAAGTIGGLITVSSGGLISGTGTIGALLVSSGATVAPGNSIGTLNVAGNITFASGSIYQVEVNATGQADKIAAGTANINGGNVQVLAAAGTYAPLTQYSILTTTGGRTGTFSGVSSNLAFLTPSLSYDANSVYLTMTRNNINFAAIGVTSNQSSTGAGVESSGWGNPVYNAVLNLSAPQARAAFDQLSGEVNASSKTVILQDSHFLRDASVDRLRSAFDGVGATPTPVMSYAPGGPVLLPGKTERFAVWGRAFGGWGTTASNGTAARMRNDVGGAFIGADGLVGDNWRVGLLAGYSRSSFRVNDRSSSGASDNYHLGIYGGSQFGAFVFRSGASISWHDLTTNRAVSFAGLATNSLHGRQTARTAQVFGEVGYGIRAGSFGLEPFANLAYVNLTTDGFSETGGPAALNVRGNSTGITFTTLGLRASQQFNLGSVSLTARGTLGWRYAFGDVTPISAAAFAGGTPFSVAGLPIAKNAAIVEAGLDFNLTSQATLGISYGGQFGSRLTDQTIKGNFAWKF